MWAYTGIPEAILLHPFVDEGLQTGNFSTLT